ncbi:MAG: hypothetical protein AAGA60_26310 [Cyanobacteria bacterium P01_E01_bin.42]
MSAEDQIIAKLQLHRDIKNLTIQELQNANITCQETSFTDPKGDIAIASSKDTSKVQEVIRQIQKRANS